MARNFFTMTELFEPLDLPLVASCPSGLSGAKPSVIANLEMPIVIVLLRDRNRLLRLPP